MNYIEELRRNINENHLTDVKGEIMENFETKGAALFGNKYGVSTCNGTSALYLALFCASLQSKKNEVILPAYGFHAMVSVVCAFGLKSVFSDVDPETYTMDFKKWVFDKKQTKITSFF